MSCQNQTPTCGHSCRTEAAGHGSVGRGGKEALGGLLRELQSLEGSTKRAAARVATTSLLSFLTYTISSWPGGFVAFRDPMLCSGISKNERRGRKSLLHTCLSTPSSWKCFSHFGTTFTHATMLVGMSRWPSH